MRSLNAAHKKILGHHWRCETRHCIKAQSWPERLLDWPLLDWPLLDWRGVPTCSACLGVLRQLGPRTRPRSFVVADLRTGG
ncbi:hypothetical protein ACFV2U_29015 [Streptomyces sp. NPDC059697]|uniref:hypothetical protein n=1 Tax=Streptomyces sp. NPDC059697 TaxID=3346912 RepID=UPI0036BA9DBB